MTGGGGRPSSKSKNDMVSSSSNICRSELPGSTWFSGTHRESPSLESRMPSENARGEREACEVLDDVVMDEELRRAPR